MWIFKSFAHLNWVVCLIIEVCFFKSSSGTLDKKSFVKYVIYSFTGGSGGKESACNAGDTGAIPE